MSEFSRPTPLITPPGLSTSPFDLPLIGRMIYRFVQLILASCLSASPILANTPDLDLTPQQHTWLRNAPVIKVGGSPDWTPFNFVGDNGQYQGLAKDTLDLISAKSGLKFEYSIDAWRNNLQKAYNKEIDLLPAVYHTEERDQHLLFSPPYFEMLDYFFVRDNLAVNTLQDLNGKRVALPKGYAHIRFIQQHFPDIKIVLVNSFSAAIDAVLENRADLLYDTYGSLIYSLRKQGINSIIPFKSTRHLGKRHIHIATRNDRPELAAIIKKCLQAISHVEKQAITEKWLGASPIQTSPRLQLTAEQQQWIKDHPIIKYAAEKDWKPYDFVNADGKHTGVVRDFLDEISHLTGLSFNPIVGDWNDLLNKAKNQQLDILPAIYHTPDRENYFIFTQAYHSLLDYIFIRSDVLNDNEPTLKGKTVTVTKGSSTIDLIKKRYPELKILPADNLMMSIENIIEKKADLLVESYPVINYLLNSHNITTLRPYQALTPGKPQKLRMATHKSNRMLANIISQALSAIPESRKQAINLKWFASLPLDSTQRLALSSIEQQWLDQHPIINLGSESNWPPYEFMDDAGHHKGLTIDVIHLLEQKLGVRFNIISEFSWGETLNKLRNKEIDVVGSIVKTPERSIDMNFSDAYIAPPTVIYTRKDAPPITRMEDLNGKKIAIENGYYLHEKLQKEFPHLTLHVVEDTTSALKAVSYGDADAYLGNQGASNWLIEQNALTNLRIAMGAKFGQAELRFAMRKDWPLLPQIINKALRSLSNEDMLTIRRKWLGLENKKNKLLLSETEKRWLDAHKQIRFVGDPNWLPYEAIDKHGNYTGIVAEHLKLIEQQLGVTFELVNTPSWSDSLKKFESGEVDMISETVDSGLHAQASFSRPYLSSPIVIVMDTKQNYVDSIAQIETQQIAVIKDYGYVHSIKKAYPQLTLVEANNIQEGLTAVSTGRVDALLATLAQASYHIADQGINNIRIVGKTEFTTQLAFAFSPQFAPLADLINRALDTISLSQKQHIHTTWSKPKFVTRVDYQLLLQIVAGFLLIVALFIYWTLRLSREIKHRKIIEAQTQALIDHVPLQILVTDYNGQILTANPQTQADYNIHPSELNLYNVADFYQNPEDRQAVKAEIQRDGKVEQKIIPFKKLNGELRSMMLSIMPIHYHHTDCLLTIAVDMTERLEMEQVMAQAKDSAEAANRAKSAFLANMSHEIRTPMNAIIGFTDLLNEQVQDPKLSGYIKTIQSAGNNLLTIINDILDLSKIEAGKLDIQKTPTNPHFLFTELSDVFMLKMREKDLDFILDIDPVIPENLLLDAVRLRQILLNLLGNAVKFTEHGYVKMIARTDNEDHIRSKLDLIIEVEDSGIGISSEQQQHIFQEFSQSKGQNTSHYGGTGLGLSISKRLANMMGGHIILQSQPGKGSTFTLRLNAVDISSMALATLTPGPTTGYNIEFQPANILIVDDVFDNRQLLVESFANTAINLRQAENGLDAVNLAKQHAFDLILMDIRMPVMDGYQAAASINSFSQVPIIALTASVMTDEHERLKSDHFQGYLRKPVLKHDLMDELAKFLPHQKTAVKPKPKNKISLSPSEILSLPQVLADLQTLIPVADALKENNNLADIQSFADQLFTLLQTHPIAILEQYAKDLQNSLDCFDIAGIRKNIHYYPELVEKLLEINTTTHQAE